MFTWKSLITYSDIELYFTTKESLFYLFFLSLGPLTLLYTYEYHRIFSNRVQLEIESTLGAAYNSSVPTSTRCKRDPV